ncbi:MAG TPA: polyketide cyclase, partial [Rhodoglobus sp.]|nr:polyketide cyclase [Rhodoglobus sp.]
MWTTAVTADTDLPRAAVWAALEALHRGELSYPGADVFELHGPFAVGTELDVTPEGQDTFRSVIIELVRGERYADRTEYEGL